jgi:hypothetical protein
MRSGERLAARLTAGIVLCLVVGRANGGQFDGTVKAFEEQAQYVKPIATLLGSMSNASWYQSAAVPKEFGFYVGLPISLIYINSRDRQYTDVYVDTNCIECKEFRAEYPEHGIDCAECVSRVEYTAPTLFGTSDPPILRLMTLDHNKNVIDYEQIHFSGGLEGPSSLSLLPFATIHADLSWYHTAVKLRYVGVPEISGISFHMPGFGLQHDFSSFLPESFPVSLGVAGNLTLVFASWAPGENIDGELELDGMAGFAGIVAGRRFGRFEIFLESGWEGAKLEAGGNLDINYDDGTSEKIRPGLTLTGRNIFRAALNVAVDLGGYRPVVGQIFGADMGSTLNIIGYRYTGEK